MRVWVYGIMCVHSVSKNRWMQLFHWQCGTEDGETKRMLRRVQMYIDEDPVNHLLNKSKTILI